MAARGVRSEFVGGIELDACSEIINLVWWGFGVSVRMPAWNKRLGVLLRRTLTDVETVSDFKPIADMVQHLRLSQ
ncbi:hypothetical protein NQZ68_002567 [Dissostichus eleginoides]|nr:hypothetical protein NQZ68_002567 [Dissostichus eleginoides]